MSKTLVLALPFVFLPGLALAAPDNGSWLGLHANFKMMNDGSMARAMEEGRANVDAWKRLQAAEQAQAGAAQPRAVFTSEQPKPTRARR